MIDLHCHLLPGIDDGARNLKDSLALARFAIDNGIKKAVMTPHIHAGTYDNDIETIRPAFTSLKNALEEQNIPLEIAMAGEVRIGPEIMSMIAEKRIPFLGKLDDYDILLLEMPYNHIPVGSDKLVTWLLKRNIRPIIAHPERNGDVVRHLEKIYPFVEQGCLLQITASSITGNFGSKLQLRAQQMLENGWVDIIASDAHNLNHRPPDLESGRAAAAEIVGEAAAWKLVHETPEKISQIHWNN